MPPRRSQNPFFDALKQNRYRYDAESIVDLFGEVDQARVEALAGQLAGYISANLPNAFERREGLGDYRTNPYVLMTSASVMNLDDPRAFGTFLFNSKLYMALETSFGKSIEAAFVSQYPIGSPSKWVDAPEKLEEFAAQRGANREDRARQRTSSAWREIDKSCIVGNRRYLTSIKSGPNTINDTQVQAMTNAIAEKHLTWAQRTRQNHPSVTELDIVLGLTYGTDRTTNNKENQVLVKLLEYGFEEEDRVNRPGVLIDTATRSTRVYRRIGQDFWSFIGRPDAPDQARFVFLEVLLALARALAQGMEGAQLEDRINRKIMALQSALGELRFPRQSLPAWVRDKFNDDQLFWFATAMTAFFDEGI